MSSEKTETKKRGIFELSSDTRILYNVLEKNLIKDGNELVTYKELSDSIGRNVQGEARGLLGTARKMIQNQHKIILEVVMNEGIKISENYEGVIDRATSHVRRTVRNTSKTVGNALNGQPITATVAAKFSVMNAIELFSRPNMPKKLIETIENNKLRELSAAETLKLFQES